MNGEQPNENEGNDGLIVCGGCAHPNLAFRAHCRRCGASLMGSGNLIPGVELVEWTKTDGPERRGPRRSTSVLGLTVLAACVLLPALAVSLRSLVSGWVSVLIIVGGWAVVFCWLVKESRARRAGPEDEGDGAEAGEGPVCPRCHAVTMACDDVCSVCGEIVAADFLEPE